MIERVLLAVDASAASRQAVAYVGRIFGPRPPGGYEITLFHVVDTVPADQVPAVSSPDLQRVLEQALQDWAHQAVERAVKQMEKYRELLATQGVPLEAVKLKHHLEEVRPEARRVAAALAILREARDGGYTTVVLGRRGSSNVPDLYLGGVAEKVSRHLAGATVWIVD
ncbi:MAG: hypothetical protein C4297_07505 [Gemmataceae bacterium]